MLYIFVMIQVGMSGGCVGMAVLKAFVLGSMQDMSFTVCPLMPTCVFHFHAAEKYLGQLNK